MSMAEFISDTSETKQIETKKEVNPRLQPFVANKLYHGEVLEYYNAGLPGYESNFPRDDAVSAILSGDSHLLQTHPAMCVRFQATETNARNGAYPGKIHHEIHIEDQEVAQISLEGREDRSTEYNSCDSTALFLIGVEQLRMVDPGAYTEFIRKYSDNVHAAAIHIMEMLDENGLFTDNPPNAPGEGPNAPGRFGLRVTYWKDSVLPSVNAKEEPRYPVSYALAHFIAARGILSAAATLESQYYADTADRMYQRGIATFMREDGFTIYQDGDGPYVQASSDELHSLAYIPNYYSHLLPLAAIRQRAEQLETPFGYACTPKNVGENLRDTYHGYKVWIFEQALIDHAAKKFAFEHEATVAAQVQPIIHSGQELVGVYTDPSGTVVALPEGNDRQLWSVAAQLYFDQEQARNIVAQSTYSLDWL